MRVRRKVPVITSLKKLWERPTSPSFGLAICLSSLVFIQTLVQPNAFAKENDSKFKAYQIMLSPDDAAGAKALSEHRGNAQQIPCMIWQARHPKASMLAIHGFGLHKATYKDFAEQMAKIGISVYAIDVRGFGHWVRKGANELDFNGTLFDIGLALKEIKRTNQNKPIVVLGESMGGAIALARLLNIPI